MFVPRDLNPQPFALLTQCSTIEPQEHSVFINIKMKKIIISQISLLSKVNIIIFSNTLNDLDFDSPRHFVFHA